MRRLASVLLFALGSSVVAGCHPGPPIITRTQGADRYETAANLSRAGYPIQAAVVHIATGASPFDALAGAPAAAHEGGPILLVAPNELPGATRSELRRLNPSRVVLLGGVGAISATVEAQVRQAVPSARVRRIWGESRYETAAAISAATFEQGVERLYLATGEGFPDALTAGPAARSSGGPLLPVLPGGVPASVLEEIDRLAPRSITILGGLSAVGRKVEEQVRLLTSGAIDRAHGFDRYLTGVAVTSKVIPQADTVFLATGRSFPDAIAGGAAAAARFGALLLVEPNCVPAAVNRELDRLRPHEIVIVGGTATVGSGVESRTECPPTPSPGCAAFMSDPTPPAGGSETVFVTSDLLDAEILVTARSRTTTRTFGGFTNAYGYGQVFPVEGFTAGSAVVVDVRVGDRALCRTGFTPRSR